MLLAVLLAGSGCTTMYYSTMEKLGYDKRDLLKKEVSAVKEDQEEATEQFKDALTRLKEITGHDGAELEQQYDLLKADYNLAERKAERVRKRIADIQEIANNLFTEWEEELAVIQSENLRKRSREQLMDTQVRFRNLENSLVKAEQSMEPVLVQLNDYVLFLKHNLNAQAIGSLQGESLDIQKDIDQLISDMNNSIQRAEEFLNSMP